MVSGAAALAAVARLQASEAEVSNCSNVWCETKNRDRPYIFRFGIENSILEFEVFRNRKNAVQNAAVVIMTTHLN